MAGFDFKDLLPIAGSVFQGLLGSRGAEKAGETAADASQYAADLQFQAANNALDFQKDVFNYQAAQAAYDRMQAERNLGMNIGAYGDQYGLTQGLYNSMGNQLNYGNQLRQLAMGNLQQFANLGLGSLSGLSAMTGGTGAGITGPTNFNVQAPQAMSPLGPSRVQYTPQDTESIFNDIINNLNLPTGSGTDEEEEDFDPEATAEQIADWWIRTQGGIPGTAVGETGGEGLGPSGNFSGGLADLPSTPGYSDFITNDLGLLPSMPVSPNTARAIGYGISTPIGMLLSNMTDEEMALNWGKFTGLFGPTSRAFGIEGTSPGIGLGFSGYSGFDGQSGSMGGGLGGYGDSGLAGIGGMGDLGDPMGGDLGLL